MHAADMDLSTENESDILPTSCLTAQAEQFLVLGRASMPLDSSSLSEVAMLSETRTCRTGPIDGPHGPTTNRPGSALVSDITAEKMQDLCWLPPGRPVAPPRNPSGSNIWDFEIPTLARRLMATIRGPLKLGPPSLPTGHAAASTVQLKDRNQARAPASLVGDRYGMLLFTYTGPQSQYQFPMDAFGAVETTEYGPASKLATMRNKLVSFLEECMSE